MNNLNNFIITIQLANPLVLWFTDSKKGSQFCNAVLKYLHRSELSEIIVAKFKSINAHIFCILLHVQIKYSKTYLRPGLRLIEIYNKLHSSIE